MSTGDMRLIKEMKKWYGGILTSLLMLFVLGFFVIKNSINSSNFTDPLIFKETYSLKSINAAAPPALPTPGNTSQVIPAEATVVNDLFFQTNLSKEEKSCLQTWNHFKHLATNAQTLPNAVEAINEAATAWRTLRTPIEEQKVRNNGSLPKIREIKRQCPHFLRKINASEVLDLYGFSLQVPCGLTQGSSITFIGIPNGNFRVDLIGEQLPGEPFPPIIMHYNVRLNGIEDPVIIQSTWTIGHGWGEMERCPSPDPEKNKKVDDQLEQCNYGKQRKYFPFKQNELFVATLGVGSEGIHLTVDGKHITSSAFRETLEPCYVSEVRISGDVDLTSVVATGLPASGDIDDHIDLEALKAVPLPPQGKLDLFIGVFSTADNYKRRMAVRRSWMQYPQIRSGQAAVRFFVGLHKTQMVNEELWNEARTYGDIQLMPFVDLYSIITLKTIAICIFGTEVVSAKFIMKTDDDAFVRVDEILNSLRRTNVTHGLLYGLINSDSKPQRSLDSKWYISPEEWTDDRYPPFAHGPGYVVSSDIARTVSKKHRKGRLKMFKLEDVAMGIWIADMKKNKKGLEVRYEKDERIINLGCQNGYVVAHYQSPRKLHCLWQKIQDPKTTANCCGNYTLPPH